MEERANIFPALGKSSLRASILSPPYNLDISIFASSLSVPPHLVRFSFNLFLPGPSPLAAHLHRSFELATWIGETLSRPRFLGFLPSSFDFSTPFELAFFSSCPSLLLCIRQNRPLLYPRRWEKKARQGTARRSRGSLISPPDSCRSF